MAASAGSGKATPPSSSKADTKPAGSRDNLLDGNALIAAQGGREAAEDPNARPTNDKGEEVDAQGLTEEQREVVRDLKKRDQEVRRHEQAHMAAGGPYAGSASYTYQAGPDGQRYAVGGEVPIDSSPVPGNPEATIRKLETVRRAALAPADPSGQDQAVAAAAGAAILQARQAASEQRRAEAEGEDGEGGPAEAAPTGAPKSAGATPTSVTPGRETRNGAQGEGGETGGFGAGRNGGDQGGAASARFDGGGGAGAVGRLGAYSLSGYGGGASRGRAAGGFDLFA
jgi:hypothetical protein